MEEKEWVDMDVDNIKRRRWNINQLSFFYCNRYKQEGGGSTKDWDEVDTLFTCLCILGSTFSDIFAILVVLYLENQDDKDYHHSPPPADALTRSRRPQEYPQ